MCVLRHVTNHAPLRPQRPHGKNTRPLLSQVGYRLKGQRRVFDRLQQSRLRPRRDVEPVKRPMPNVPLDFSVMSRSLAKDLFRLRSEVTVGLRTFKDRLID